MVYKPYAACTVVPFRVSSSRVECCVVKYKHVSHPQSQYDHHAAVTRANLYITNQSFPPVQCTWVLHVILPSTME